MQNCPEQTTPGYKCPVEYIYIAQCISCADGRPSYTIRCRECDRMTLQLLNFQLRGEPDLVFDSHQRVPVVLYHAHDWMGREQHIRLGLQAYSGQEVVITIPTNEGTDL